jgi:hypothetical protein
VLLVMYSEVIYHQCEHDRQFQDKTLLNLLSGSSYHGGKSSGTKKRKRSSTSARSVKAPKNANDPDPSSPDHSSSSEDEEGGEEDEEGDDVESDIEERERRAAAMSNFMSALDLSSSGLQLPSGGEGPSRLLVDDDEELAASPMVSHGDGASTAAVRQRKPTTSRPRIQEPVEATQQPAQRKHSFMYDIPKPVQPDAGIPFAQVWFALHPTVSDYGDCVRLQLDCAIDNFLCEVLLIPSKFMDMLKQFMLTNEESRKQYQKCLLVARSLLKQQGLMTKVDKVWSIVGKPGDNTNKKSYTSVENRVVLLNFLAGTSLEDSFVKQLLLPFYFKTFPQLLSVKVEYGCRCFTYNECYCIDNDDDEENETIYEIQMDKPSSTPPSFFHTDLFLAVMQKQSREDVDRMRNAVAVSDDEL